MSESILIRRARSSEAETLSRIALESKAFWGYSDAFMAACRDELLVTQERLLDSTYRYVVAEREGLIVGFYALAQVDADTQELEALFVTPASIGSGIGRQLMSHAAENAASLGAKSILIHSDPNAESFYLAAGCRRIGEITSGSVAGRVLPLLELELEAS